MYLDTPSKLTNKGITVFMVIFPLVPILTLYSIHYQLTSIFIAWCIQSTFAYGGYRLGRGKLKENFENNKKKFIRGFILGLFAIPLPIVLSLIYVFYISSRSYI